MEKPMLLKAEVIKKEGEYGDVLTVNIFVEIDPEINMETGLGQNHRILTCASPWVAYVLPNLYPEDHLLLAGYFQEDNFFFAKRILRYEPKTYLDVERKMFENHEKYIKTEWRAK